MLVFFFQAEDGIRDYKVTGVQTCALPICQEGPGRRGPAAHSLPGSTTTPTISSALDTTCPSTEQDTSANAILLFRTLASFAWILSWSPGRTGLRNLTLSALMKNAGMGTQLLWATIRMPAACAIASS